jgi:hypothetical protein
VEIGFGRGAISFLADFFWVVESEYMVVACLSVSNR